MLRHLRNLSGWGETGPLRTSQFLQIAKGSARGMPLISKLTSPETYVLCLAYTPQEAMSLCANLARTPGN